MLEQTREFMNNPARITIPPRQKTAEKAEQLRYHVGREEKFGLLLGLLRREGGSRILIFTNTREEARRLEDRLGRNGWLARALTGDVDQDNLCYYPPAFLAGLACVGVDRIVIGSDAPFVVGDLKRSVQDIRDFTFLPERDRAKILGESALRFLGLAK